MVQTDKFDPRRNIFEHAGTSVVSLLFAAVAGDVTALARMYLQGVDMSAADYDGQIITNVISRSKSRCRVLCSHRENGIDEFHL